MEKALWPFNYKKPVLLAEDQKMWLIHVEGLPVAAKN
jgi:hypothetical protein